MSTPRVYIAYVGGTIGMRESGHGYAPSPRHLVELLASSSELRRDDVPRFDIHEYEPLLDSANMLPEHWLEIARDITARRRDYDGFVVLHGTDTMAYTASALSFLLRGLNKPVVVTGSQIPLTEVRSDGWDHLITSLVLAGRHRFHEVGIYFDHRLLRGNRSVKVDADRFGAFESPAFPPLGEAGVDILLRPELLLPPARIPIELPARLEARLAVLRLFPGIGADMVEHLLRAPLQGLVLECYGAGTGPEHDRHLLRAIEAATSRDVVIVAVSQCLRGHVDLEQYAAGSAFASAGVVSGLDLTTEAALTKLYWLLGRGVTAEVARREIPRPIAGEVNAEPHG